MLFRSSISADRRANDTLPGMFMVQSDCWEIQIQRGVGGPRAVSCPPVVYLDGSPISSSFEALGMSLLGSSQLASPDAEKADSAAESARVLVQAIHSNLKPRDIITRKSIENAIALVMATGGSTNAVLHLLALAGRVGTRHDLDDWQRWGRGVPTLVDLMPAGRFLMEDFYYAGGLRALLGEQATLVCEGQRVRPAVLEERGFEFHYPTLEAALEEILR